MPVLPLHSCSKMPGGNDAGSWRTGVRRKGMLRSAATLQGYAISGSDGEIGQVDRLFFDDEKWTVRHLVVDTGKWLPGRRVLISPAAVERIDPDCGRIHLNLTREVIRNSPDVD